MDQYIGKMLDNRYEILECIGNGGMAVVYKARDHRLNRLVAVKILKPELASDADFRRRFHDESQAVAMLSHTNIVSVYDVSQSDGLDYIVMELIDGMTLKQYIRKRGASLNWREAIHFITQILRALDHAHSRGIIHRDIKPQNVLILRDGSVKVTDFGIARIASAAQHTMTAEAIGSVHYISPEQAKGSHVDARTDIYSAGVVLYEMLTGRLPFEGDNPVNVAIQHINSIPIPPRELNPDIPQGLEDIVLKAMAPDLNQRYSSAEVMLEDINEFRKNPAMRAAVPVREEAVDEPTVIISSARQADPEPVQQRPAVRTREQVPVRENRYPARREEPEYEDDYGEGVGSRLASFAPVIAVAAIVIFVIGMGLFVWNVFIKDIVTPGPPELPEEFTVPNLLGLTMDDVRRNPDLLEGFTLEAGSEIYSEEYEKGQICNQSPEAGEKVKEGDGKVIRVNISSGVEELRMLYLINQEYHDAELKLTNMGIEVVERRENSDTITKDYVIRTDPEEGEVLEKGQTVIVVISDGPATKLVNVISFVGLDLDNARKMIEKMGLVVGEVSPNPSNEYAAGRVMWQSVPSTSSVPEGTAIDLWVSTGPEPTPEPTPSPTPEPTPSPTPEPTPEPTPTEAPPTEAVPTEEPPHDEPVPPGEQGAEGGEGQ